MIRFIDRHYGKFLILALLLSGSSLLLRMLGYD